MSLIMTIGAFLPGLFGKQVSDRVSRILGIITLGVVMLSLLGIGKCAYDGAVIAKYEAKKEAKAAPAREAAADQRLEDQIINTKNEEELIDAIEAAPQGGTLSPAARALACQRLRKLGRIPPACRPEGGDGSQANPD